MALLENLKFTKYFYQHCLISLPQPPCEVDKTDGMIWIFKYCSFVVCFGAISRGAWDLLLTLCLRVTPGNAQGTYHMQRARDQTGVGFVQSKYLIPFTISLIPIFQSFISLLLQLRELRPSQVNPCVQAQRVTRIIISTHLEPADTLTDTLL